MVCLTQTQVSGGGGGGCIEQRNGTGNGEQKCRNRGSRGNALCSMRGAGGEAAHLNDKVHFAHHAGGHKSQHVEWGGTNINTYCWTTI